MTITVDCRWIDASGVGVYIRECLPFFLRSGNFFFLLGNSEKLRPLVSERNNTEILDCSVKPFSLRELFSFPKKLLKKINSCDLYYSPYFNIPGFIKIPVYTTIHDIIFPDMPELTSRLGLAARMWFYRRAFNRSKKIFTVSEFSKSRIEHYSRCKVPVVVTHSAIQPRFLAPSPEGKPRPGATLPPEGPAEIPGVTKKNIILFVGNIKKHKGLSILIEAFLQARREGLDYKLVIVGSRDNFRSVEVDFSSGHDPSGSGSIEFSGFLPDEKLLRFLAEASLLVQPSLYEGFCLPPLEALAAGTSALLSDIPVLREIYEEYPKQKLGQEFPVHWFKAGDIKDLKEKLLSLLCNKKAREVNLPNELKNLYTFEKTSQTILEHLS